MPDKNSDLGTRFRVIYRIDREDSELWDAPAKIELAVAKLPKRSVSILRMFPS